MIHDAPKQQWFYSTGGFCISSGIAIVDYQNQFYSVLCYLLLAVLSCLVAHLELLLTACEPSFFQLFVQLSSKLLRVCSTDMKAMCSHVSS